MYEARSFWTTAAGQGALQTEVLAALRPGEVRVRTLFGAISRGTEALVFHGRVPESEWDAMRGPHQAGSFPFPVKYGYITVGIVEEGAGVGTTVFCLHPHQTAFHVPAEQVTPIPAHIPPERAVLAANLETALNGVWDAGIAPGDRVTVVGAGVVGCLVGWLAARIPGTTVTLVDVLPERAGLAEQLGLRFCLPADAPSDQDQVVHASASPAGLATAIGCAGIEAVVLEMSWYGSGTVPAPLGGAFHSRRISLRSSQVGRIPPGRAPRWTYRRRLAVALDLLAAPELDHLIDGESSFDDLPATMARITRQSGVLCHRIVYPSAR